MKQSREHSMIEPHQIAALQWPYPINSKYLPEYRLSHDCNWIFNFTMEKQREKKPNKF